MSEHEGAFIWYELVTSNPQGAETFYRSVIGWSAQPFGEAGDYMILSAGERPVAGITGFPQDCGGEAAPGWIGYLAVADVDAATKSLGEAGGTVHRGPAEIPGVGRFSIASDPQGAALMLMTPDAEDQPGPDPMTPGHVGWHELHSSDWEAAFAFYAGQFGWTKAEALDMGDMGTYQLFATSAGKVIGGMMNNQHSPRPHWLFYFAVDEIGAARQRIADHGGEILNGPMEVPGGAWIVQAKDPQGAVFAVVGMRS